MDDYKEGFIHAVCQMMNNSITDIRGIAMYTLSEEGFDCYEDTMPYTKDWTPEQNEVRIVADAFKAHLADFESNPKSASELTDYGDSSPTEGMPTPELAAYTMTANLLLNLDEAVCKN